MQDLTNQPTAQHQARKTKGKENLHICIRTTSPLAAPMQEQVPLPPRAEASISSFKHNAKISTKTNRSIKQQERSKTVGDLYSENGLNPRGFRAHAAELCNSPMAFRTTRDAPTSREVNLGEASFFKFLFPL